MSDPDFTTVWADVVTHTEAVTITHADGSTTSVSKAAKRPISLKELSLGASLGLQASDCTITVPGSLLGSAEILQGDKITDADSVSWIVLSIVTSAPTDIYRCFCRRTR